MSFLKSWFSSSPESAVVAPAVTSSKATPPPSNPALVTELNPNGYKPCCVCTEPKSLRDTCFRESADGEAECQEPIEAYKACMRSYGFKV